MVIEELGQASLFKMEFRVTIHSNSACHGLIQIHFQS